MGLIKEIEQKNGNPLLEIIYGGKEAPFGGVDTSAPPAYIDPRCFAASDGFLVIDNKLVAASWQPVVTPTLWGGTANVILLKFGSFYNSLNGQLNYALGYLATPFVGPPSGVNYVFYMTSWSPSNPTVPLNDTLPITLFDNITILEQASITLDLLSTNNGATTAGSGASGTVTVFPGTTAVTSTTITGGTGYVVGNFVQVTQGSANSAYIEVITVDGSGGILTSNVVNPGTGYQNGLATAGTAYTNSNLHLQWVGPSGTQSVNVTSSAVQIFTIQQALSTIANPPQVYQDVTLSTTLDGLKLIVTANVPGIVGNTITVQDLSTNQNAGVAPPLYFSCRTPRNLEGGQITEPSTAPLSFTPPASTTEVGGTLYIANLGPMILKYSGPGEFTTSTMYNGVGIIRKFEGSLIGLRLENQLGVFTQNQDMIFAWTAAENLDEWAPVSTTGNVTGAGFTQIADIGDYLTGLIVSGATAFIIRSQGISYATATGNGTLPFTFNHVGLGDQGEGAQVSNLVCQYDQVGVFVGNTNIYQISGQISPIGEKIKAALFKTLQQNYAGGNVISCNACATYIGGDVISLAIFSTGISYIGFGQTPTSVGLFVFNPSNGTWMEFTFPAEYDWVTVGMSGYWNYNLKTLILDTFATVNQFSYSDSFNQNVMILGLQYRPDGKINNVYVPVFYALQEGIPNSLSISNPATVTFPVEEVSFGRDITIDSLYVSLWAQVLEDTLISFYITGSQNVSAPGLPAVYVPTKFTLASYTLKPAQFNSLSGDPIEIQVFSASNGAGAITLKSPQLSYTITSLVDTGTAFISISKIGMFASFDPTQRPV